MMIIITWKKAIIFGLAWGIGEGLVSGLSKYMGF
jgi:hypothetical protein